MKYDHDISWVRKVLQSADVMNTFNGGTVAPQAKLDKYEDHYILNLKIPGIGAEKLQMEIVNSNLMIYHTVNFDDKEEGLLVPHVLANFPLSSIIDFRNITASYEDRKLRIFMPLNELKSGYHQHIDIKK